MTADINLQETFSGRDPADIIDELWSMSGTGDAPGYILPEVLRASRSELTVARALWDRVGPELSLTRLGEVFSAMRRLGIVRSEAQTHRFFQRSRRSFGAPLPPMMLEISAGPASTGGRVSPFLVALDLVTQEAYASFDPARPVEDRTQPVTGVTWFEANLYSAFVRCFLPAEAEMDRVGHLSPTEVTWRALPTWCFDGCRTPVVGVRDPLGRLDGKRAVWNRWGGRASAWPSAGRLRGAPIGIRLVSNEEMDGAPMRRSHAAANSIA